MDARKLCTSCMQGMLRGGICQACLRKDSAASENRQTDALPDRYVLNRRYMLGRVIGKGGFGITYLAWDLAENRRVLVKELFPNKDVQRNPRTGLVTPVPGQEAYFQKCRQRFKEEAELLHSFRGEPAILNVYRLMEANNTVCYSMEYLTGCDLQTKLRQEGKQSWDRLSGYVRSILYSLRILHAKGLIHRDITPDNIFLISQTEAKLIDFGSVRSYDSGQGLTVILKKSFAPVEQYFTGGNQGPWTDIYSLCVTIYYAMSGEMPPMVPDQIYKKLPPKPIRQLCPELPAHVAAAIMKGMSLQAADRFADVKEMAAALFPGEPVLPVAGQVLPARMADPDGYVIRALSGYYAGQRLRIGRGQRVEFGRDAGCAVCYPAGCEGVSRHQCWLFCDVNGGLYVRDDGSTYGTFVLGRRIQAGVPRRLGRGDIFGFGRESCCVE